MPTLHLLGTGAALSSPDRTTTMLAVEGDSLILVDCGGDVVQRVLQAGLDLDKLKLVILSHEHPDHVSGFPLFMEKIWLAQRRRAIPVCGPRAAIEQARRLFEAFDTSGWRGLPQIAWHEVPLQENATIWSDDEWRITASPGQHSVPVVGVRLESAAGGATLVYSADTEPAGSIERLAAGVDLLVHEATGRMKGHTSATAAAELSKRAGARRLVLVHLPPRSDPHDLSRARETFPDLELGRDLARYAF